MKAMILSAGRGKRMGELTKNCPKPLLKVHGKTLIEWQIERLKNNGFTDLVINLGYLGETIKTYLGRGKRLGVNITYSIEPQKGLETGGGVFQALKLLGDEPFLLTNADIFCNFPYQTLANQSPDSIHLVLVTTPSFKATGDFSLKHRYLTLEKKFTFSGISIINPQIFRNCQPGFYPIAPLFTQAIQAGTATGELFLGQWQDVGTPERLAMVKRISP